MSMGIVQELAQKIRDIPDFPQKGIIFKDNSGNEKGVIQHTSLGNMLVAKTKTYECSYDQL